jgi:hypothetical protein
MASQEKIQEFLVAMDMEKQLVVVDQIYDSMREDLAEKEGEFGTGFMDFQKRIQAMVFKRINDLFTEIYGDFFSDQELDEMIRIFSSPVYKRIQAMIPEIIKRLTDQMPGLMKEIEHEVKVMCNDFIEKREPKTLH